MRSTNSKRISVLFVSIFILALLLPGTALATYGYDYGHGSLLYTPYNVKAANDAWAKLGHNYSVYQGNGFTKSAFLGNCQYGDGVYAYSHGSAGTRGAIYDDRNVMITPTNVTDNRKGNWLKLVFMDACYSADNSNMATAWGIQTGDGSVHAYVGWVGLSADTEAYYNFTRTFWSSIGSKYTVNESLSRAATASGKSHYRTYGSINWRY